MAAKVEKQFGVTAELIPSSGGVFEVTVDGKLIHSKKQRGEFPVEWALLDQISELDKQ